ncbi:AAA family ATPase [Desertihabitans aurantiacus]|uniref:AAA family ATPase n=1 Tax=Desertihabitans aurantiacus TaxID=2282477 RepID=UPI000DF7857F|nr:AAA family ATPase [Desertihabitans aurantiacus]
MNRVVIAIADQVMVQELRSRLDQSELDLEVAFVADSTSEMTAAVLSHRPNVLVVHDQLGPGSIAPPLRDLALRQPSLAVVVVTSARDADSYRTALDVGARAVLPYPFSLEEVEQRLTVVSQWSQSVRSAIANQLSEQQNDSSWGARVVAVAGAKGGVGATVMATHLAWDLATSEPDMRICLVDLDLEKGDVPSYLDVAHRVSIADLAKISEDLAARAVADTVVEHASGLHLLLAPVEIRDTEVVTPEAVRRVVAQLRNLYHLVVIDTGSAVTTTQAAAVESADLTLQVVTADVPALRAARRQVLAWESLAVSSADSVQVVVNRFQRRSEIQNDTVDQLVLGGRTQVLVPDLDRGLERAGNSRTPSEVRSRVWWKSLRALAEELELTRRFREVQQAATEPEVTARRQRAPEPAAPRRRLRQRAEAGQVSLENAALIPVAVVLLVVCLQAALLGVSFVWSGIAADSAARAVAIGEDPARAAQDRLPPGFASELSVSRSGPATVSVRVSSPLLIGEGVTSEVAVAVDRTVVEEPR